MSTNLIYRHPVSDGAFVVSTIDLGDNVDSYDGRLVREHSFETLVFAEGGGGAELDGSRYYSLEEAKAGHQEIASRWEGAQRVTCLECMQEYTESPAARLADESGICSYDSQHKLFCAACSYEERCPDHPKTLEQ